jgi:hypothetical protein
LALLAVWLEHATCFVCVFLPGAPCVAPWLGVTGCAWCWVKCITGVQARTWRREKRRGINREKSSKTESKNKREKERLISGERDMTLRRWRGRKREKSEPRCSRHAFRGCCLYMCMYVYLRPQRARERERHREAIDFCEGLGSWAPGRSLVAISIAASTPRSSSSRVQSTPKSKCFPPRRASSLVYTVLHASTNLHPRYPHPETTTPQARHGKHAPSGPMGRTTGGSDVVQRLEAFTRIYPPMYT